MNQINPNKSFNLEMNEKAVKDTLNEFIRLYLSKDEMIDEDEWLLNVLDKNMPSLTKEEARSLLNNMNNMDELWSNINALGKDGYNADAWLFHQTLSFLQNKEAENYRYISLLSESMERVNDRVLNIVSAIYSNDLWSNHIKGGEDDDNIPHETAVKNIQHIILEECENLIQLGKNPLLLKQKDLNMLAYHFSKNATIMGIGTMIFMAEFFLANKMQQQGLSEKQRELLATALKTGKDVGLRNAIVFSLKFCSERGFLPLLAKGTSTMLFIAFAFVTVETMKIFFKYNNGEITSWQAFNEISKVSAVGICGAFLDVKGAALGMSAGTYVCPGIGTAIGGFVGGVICSTIGQRITPVVYDCSIIFLNEMTNTLQTVCNANNANKIFEIPSTIYNRLKVWN